MMKSFAPTPAQPEHSRLTTNRDARTLLISFAAYTVFLLSVEKFNVVGAGAFAAYPLFWILAAGIPLRPVLGRILVASPFVLFVAAANPFLDRRLYMTIGNVTVTAGMVSGATIVVKSMLVVTGLVVLSHLVPFYDMARGLRGMHVPEAFVVQLMLLHRYLFLLVEEGRSLVRARDLRSFGRRGKGLRPTASLIGSLFLRTVERGDRIYRAMVARGFTGSFDHGEQRRLHLPDYALMITSIGCCFALRIVL